jgi:hypothetical protein
MSQLKQRSCGRSGNLERPVKGDNLNDQLRPWRAWYVVFQVIIHLPHLDYSLLSSVLFPLIALIVLILAKALPAPPPAPSHTPSPPSTNPICANPPQDSCAFYSTCLESRYHCGPNGYPIAYGTHFCNQFSANRTLFSEQGQAWMLRVMHCLQLVLVPDAIDENSTATCQTLEKKAFRSHAPCYLDTGMCVLDFHDWKVVIDVVGWKTLFGSWEALKASIHAATGCMESTIYNILSLKKRLIV